MNFSEVDRYIRENYKKHNIPGCDIIIKQRDKILFREQYGYSDIENKIPTSANERYALYSCTKPMTVAGAMRLVEQGKLELERPVCDYLPFFRDCYLMRGGKKEKPLHPVTVKNLLTMTAGFDYNLEKSPIKELFDTHATVSNTEFARAAVSAPLIFEPGERFQYSICLDVLAAVIEEIAELPFNEYQQKVIFEPLEMYDTDFAVCEQPKINAAPLYRYNAENGQTVFASEEYASHPFFRLASGGAGVLSTASDYSKFAAAMAMGGTGENGYKLLKEETVKQISTEQLKSYTVNCDFTCAAGAGYGYGLGVRTLVNRDDGQKSPLGEFGWDGAAGSYILMDAENAISIVFTTQLLNWPSLLGTYHAPIRDLTYEGLKK